METLKHLNDVIYRYHEAPSCDYACHEYTSNAGEYFERLVRIANAAKKALESKGALAGHPEINNLYNALSEVIDDGNLQIGSVNHSQEIETANQLAHEIVVEVNKMLNGFDIEALFELLAKYQAEMKKVTERSTYF
jgi:hypothetical protein